MSSDAADDNFTDFYSDWLTNYSVSFPHESQESIIIGWRVWRLFGYYYDFTPNKRVEFLHKEKRITAYELKNFSKKLLQSTFEDSLWLPGVAAEALYNNGLSVHSHSGLYAASDESLCKDYLNGFNHVSYARQKLIYGTVSIWGEVIEHERGYRAQFMYPSKLFIPNVLGLTIARNLSDSYGCEVEVVKDFI
jgi:hypothetical protein